MRMEQVEKPGTPKKPETPKGRRPAGQDPAKRAQILEGAKRCFLQVGFAAASMNDITSEAGVSKGTIYVYFADKDDLFKALIAREKSAVMAEAKQKLYEGGTVAEVLLRFGTHVTTRLTSDEIIRAQRMVIGVIDRMPDLARQFFTADAFSAHFLLRDYLDERIAAGELAIDDTDMAARQFIDLSMTSIFKRRLFGNLEEPAPEAEIARVVASATAIFLKFYGATDCA